MGYETWHSADPFNSHADRFREPGRRRVWRLRRNAGSCPTAQHAFFLMKTFLERRTGGGLGRAGDFLRNRMLSGCYFELQDAPWFHGMRAMSIPMPHQSVVPAKIRPAPMNPESQMNAGLTNWDRRAPERTRKPAAMRTWRSREITRETPRFTGRPADAHAEVPPSTTKHFSKPDFSSLAAACFARPPDWHRM